MSLSRAPLYGSRNLIGEDCVEDMATLGQQIIERIDAMEASITDLQLNQQRPIAPGGAGRDFDQFRAQIREELMTLRDEIRGAGTTDTDFQHRRKG